MSLALKKALTTYNIHKGFQTIGIWPSNPRAMDSKLDPSTCFLLHGPNSSHDIQKTKDLDVEKILDEFVPETQENRHHFFVHVEG